MQRHIKKGTGLTRELTILTPIGFAILFYPHLISHTYYYVLPIPTTTQPPFPTTQPTPFSEKLTGLYDNHRGKFKLLMSWEPNIQDSLLIKGISYQLIAPGHAKVVNSSSQCQSISN